MPVKQKKTKAGLNRRPLNVGSDIRMLRKAKAYDGRTGRKAGMSLSSVKYYEIGHRNP